MRAQTSHKARGNYGRFTHTNVGVFSLRGEVGWGVKQSTSRDPGQAEEKVVLILVKNTACFLRLNPNFLNVNIDPNRKQEVSGLEILTLRNRPAHEDLEPGCYVTV